MQCENLRAVYKIREDEALGVEIFSMYVNQGISDLPGFSILLFWHGYRRSLDARFVPPL